MTSLRAAFVQLLLVGAVAQPLVAQTGPPVVLRPGDVVNVIIWPDDTGYSGEYVIEGTGNVTLPQLGEVRAEGVPLDQLRADILAGYRQTRPNVVVTIVPRFQVGVLGAVRSPSVYSVSPFQNLFEVIALAGGFAAQADQSKVRIVREGQVIQVDALQSLQTGVNINTYRLRSGDQIIVPPAGGITARTVFEVVRTISTMALLIDRLSN